ncbi:MAG: thiol:disulfide interchange protein DsbA/DsbL [Proteobacteria bacterium]|nr:thiol:disulfide interchange protein DsbA/DsbL [Pseudomonadota bacterium]HQR04119.1 thiol:disulfide interchange protein DsbA/DsbL [Rhodocyclaceae bacterium]
MRVFRCLAVLSAFLLSSAALALTPVEGQDYTVLNPAQPTDAPPGKVEITEFFWYGCPHCFHLEPALNQLLANLPKDVSFRRVPGMARPWTPGAKLFYALDAMGVEERLRGEIFNAIHVSQSLSPMDEAAFPEWLGKKGVDAKKFSDIYKSFSVQTKLQRAAQLNTGFGIDAVPAVVVNGRYKLVDPASMPPERFLGVVDALVARARLENGKK